jgi:hypothetical protein
MKKTLLSLSVLTFLAAPALAGGMGGCNSANKAHLASAKPVEEVAPAQAYSPVPETFVIAEAAPVVLDTSVRTAQ